MSIFCTKGTQPNPITAIILSNILDNLHRVDYAAFMRGSHSGP